MRTFTAPLVISVLALTAGACAAPPTAAIDAAETALATARTADAAQYAPEDLQEAETAMAALRAELQTQEEKFGLLRSYDKASELAAETTRMSDAAEQQATAERERLREETAEMLAAARAALEESKLLLTEAPRGKGTEADLAALANDLTLVEAALQSAEQEFGGEHYIGARNHAIHAKQTAMQVKAAIEQATQAVLPRE